MSFLDCIQESEAFLAFLVPIYVLTVMPVLVLGGSKLWGGSDLIWLGMALLVLEMTPLAVITCGALLSSSDAKALASSGDFADGTVGRD